MDPAQKSPLWITVGRPRGGGNTETSATRWLEPPYHRLQRPGGQGGQQHPAQREGRSHHGDQCEGLGLNPPKGTFRTRTTATKTSQRTRRTRPANPTRRVQMYLAMSHLQGAGIEELPRKIVATPGPGREAAIPWWWWPSTRSGEPGRTPSGPSARCGTVG